MPPLPPLSPQTIRSGWRMGVLVFVAGLLVAAATILVSLPKPDSGRPNPQPEAPLHPLSHVVFPGWSDSAVPGISAVFRPATTNLAAVIRRPRPLAVTNFSVSLRGVAGGGLSPTGRVGRAARELPVFAALRTSPAQPIPKEVADLAREITRDCKTNAERAKAIYDWLTDHISYDWKVWTDMLAGATSYTQPQDPLSVLQRGTAVCAGYAWLFDALAASVGLDATFVIGDVRGYRGTADDELVSKYLHAWNSVQIDGQWQLLDATWGARQSGETATAYLARREYYFETPANQLIFDHLPENATWQLLDTPVPDNAFAELPNLKPAFFRDGLLLGNAFSDALATTAGTPTGVTLAAPEGVAVAATLSLPTGQDISAGNLFLGENGVRRDVVVGPLAAGSYILRIYAKPATNAGPYECAADYLVNVAAP